MPLINLPERYNYCIDCPMCHDETAACLLKEALRKKPYDPRYEEDKSFRLNIYQFHQKDCPLWEDWP